MSSTITLETNLSRMTRLKMTKITLEMSLTIIIIIIANVGQFDVNLNLLALHCSRIFLVHGGV